MTGKPTVITEIGGFVDSNLKVEIVPASNGIPDATHVLASYVLPSDNDPLVISYESAVINLSLPAGTYFALFGTQSGSSGGGILQTATSPFTYRAGLIPAGILDPTTGQAFASPGEYMAVRILGLMSAPLVGSAQLQPNVDSNPAGTAEAFRYTASVTGTATRLSVYLDDADTATSVTVGLYTNTAAGDPGTLLTSGTIISPVAGRWNIVTVVGTSVRAGSDYWLALLTPAYAQARSSSVTCRTGPVDRPKQVRGRPLRRARACRDQAL
jgi:hypothetical protein